MSPRAETGPRMGPRGSNRYDSAAMFRLWVGGMSQKAIGEAQDPPIGQRSVSDRINVYIKSIPDADRRSILLRELALLDDLRFAQLEIAKDTGEDTADRLAAMRDVLKGSERLAKILGLDAAVGVDVSGTVRYEIAGVDLEAHT